MSAVRILPVAPIGKRKSLAFWDGVDKQGNDAGGLDEFEFHVYPAHPEGERLRAERVGTDAQVHVTLGDLASGAQARWPAGSATGCAGARTTRASEPDS